jgi:hypothetical protein
MTPWDLAKPGCKEDREQAALIAWANCAALHGYRVADDPRGYNWQERAQISVETNKTCFGPKPVLKLLFAIHNQGHGDAIRGARARAEGVKKGVPDLMLPVPCKIHKPTPPDAGVLMGWHHGLFIELKRLSKKPKRATSQDLTSEAQDQWAIDLIAQGYKVVTCYGWQEASQAIRDYLNV